MLAAGLAFAVALCATIGSALALGGSTRQATTIRTLAGQSAPARAGAQDGRPYSPLATTDFGDPLVGEEWWRSTIGISDLTPPGPGKPITIIDSGVMATHPELANRPNLTMLNEQQPAPIGGVHGTAVASVIGAPDNGIGIVGVYPQAVVNSWDAALGDGTALDTAQIVKGILAATARGPGVINLSLGSNEAEIAIQQAVDTAISKGMLVVAASGNDGDTGNPLTYPASYPHVLTVAASDEQNAAAVFSSRSRFVDLAAPGQDIVVASALDQGWQSEDGTSFASPMVAAAAAWVWTMRPDLDAGQLFEVMRRSATDVPPVGRDDATGWGILNVPAALAYPTPVRDPFEPNDDMDWVRPGAAFYNGAVPLTSKTKRSASVTARLTLNEDPRDLYPVYLPRQGTLTVRTAAVATVDLGLWVSTTPTVTEGRPGRDRLARGTAKAGSETLTYVNRGAARNAYLAVTMPRGVREATYTIAVSSR